MKKITLYLVLFFLALPVFAKPTLGEYITCAFVNMKTSKIMTDGGQPEVAKNYKTLFDFWDTQAVITFGNKKVRAEAPIYVPGIAEMGNDKLLELTTECLKLMKSAK